MKPTGSTVVLSCGQWDGPPPVEGDFLRTRAGRCYRIDEIKRSRPGSKGFGRLVCTVLGHDAVAEDQDGVHGWAFNIRTRVAAARIGSSDCSCNL